jgi:hypothetical protein
MVYNEPLCSFATLGEEGQGGTAKDDHWRGYKTVLVANRGIITSTSILTTVIRLMIQFDVDKLGDWFCQEVKWILAIL